MLNLKDRILDAGFWEKTFYLASKFLTKEEEQSYAELQTLAIEAARKGEKVLLESMLQSGLPVKLSAAKGYSLLMLAACNCNRETVSMPILTGVTTMGRSHWAGLPSRAT